MALDHTLLRQALAEVDTPVLVVDRDIVAANIEAAILYAGGARFFRPHVKTHKTLEVAQMQCQAGISKFKCATIPEAEMLGMAAAEDVLIAYQPQGPKVNRVIQLVKKFEDTKFSVLVDNKISAGEINKRLQSENIILDVFIDVNNGNHRTGVSLDGVQELAKLIHGYSHLSLKGLHCYDGHIRMSDIDDRKSAITEASLGVFELRATISKELDISLSLVMGGSPSFSIHKDHPDVEASPGTWIFWDARYADDYPEQPFAKAAVLGTRVISQIDSYTYCLDLGHKSVASEMSFPRVVFVDQPETKQIGHSEEHMVVKVEKEDALEVGQLLLAYPIHICPTVALYDHYQVVVDNQIVDEWKVIARDRKITV